MVCLEKVVNAHCTLVTNYKKYRRTNGITIYFQRMLLGGNEQVGGTVLKRVAAGAHIPPPWLFEPAKRPDDRADFCLNCSFLP